MNKPKAKDKHSKPKHSGQKKEEKRKNSSHATLKTAKKSEEKAEQNIEQSEEQTKEQNGRIKQNEKEAKEPTVPEPKETPILEYKRTEFQFNSTTIIKLYENGQVKYSKFYIKTSSTDNRDFSVPVEEVNFYADRLVELGFLDFKRNYTSSMNVNDSFYDSMTLDYKGYKKTVSCSNEGPDSKRYSSLIIELIKLKFDNIKKVKESRIRTIKSLRTTAVIILLAFVALLLLMSIQPGTSRQINETRTVNRTITESEALSISIANFSSSKDLNYEENVSMLAYLRKASVPVNERVSNVNQYVTDDYTNRITVLLTGLRKTREYEGLFTYTYSPQTYRVNGILRNTYKGLVLDVETIVPENKTFNFSQSIISQDIVETKTVTTNKRLNLTLGIEKVKGLLKIS